MSVQYVLKKLDSLHINYLDEDGYNLGDEIVEQSFDFEKEFEYLYREIVKKVESREIDTSNISFNFFDNVDGEWFATWSNPEVSIKINDILNDKFSKLL